MAQAVPLDQVRSFQRVSSREASDANSSSNGDGARRVAEEHDPEKVGREFWDKAMNPKA